MSSPLQDEGILFHLRRQGETSLLAVWLTRRHGVVRTHARGAAKPGSPLKGHLDLFHECEISWDVSRRTTLHHLREARVKETHAGLRQSYSRLLAATYFAQTIEHVAEPDEDLGSLHSLLRAALGWLGKKDPHGRLVERFERAVLKTLGTDDPSRSARSLLDDLSNRRPKSHAALMKVLPYDS
ncbi:MAG: recombination protein O N-terminal domain-containing protein [Verrucomicrobia bacterium]|nr:recombination protein O N-terminal domain-containing protein [Verrucomicrobiota bacterium]